jgi:lipoprotein NlpI
MGMAVRAAVVAALATLISGVAAGQAAETSSGSGVVIAAKGEILTNAHVVEACQTITVNLASGNSEAAVLVARDERNDLAVVRLTGTNNPPASVAVFREGAPLRAGDAIVALGYPLSGVLAAEAGISVGNVSALAGVADDSRYVQISAPVQPGNSGGPLLDASGHLVGIVTAKLNAVRIARFTGDIPQNVNFALKAEVARTFLDSKRIAYQTARSDKQLSPADVGDIARPFTVHIECEQTGSQSAAAAPIVRPPLSNRIEPTSPGPTASWPPPRQFRNLFDPNVPDARTPPSQIVGQLCGNFISAKLNGVRAVDQSSPNRIIDDCTAVIQLYPKDAQPYHNRAVAYHFMGDYDRAIADYTDVIRLGPTNAAAYIDRGNAYRASGDFSRAIADYTDAIRLDPKDAKVLYSRGLAYAAKGDLNRAIADYDKALTLDPKSVFAYSVRGIANLYTGAISKALADLDRASRLDSKNSYTAIWLDIVNKRSNLPSRLAQAMTQIDSTKWPAPVIRLYLGHLTPAAVLAAADAPNADTKKGQVCEANFYSAQLALQQGAKAEAARLFHLAVADCPKGFVEWPAASAELRALGESH